MTARIVEKKRTALVGLRQTRSSDPAATAALWRAFMPRRGEVEGRAGADLISMRVYRKDEGEPLTPTTPFDEWAAVEVTGAGRVPDGLEAFDLAGGTYAVFVHRGLASSFPDTARQIFGTWLPNSGYRLDDRPHLAVMGPGYRPDDPDAEEEIWVPVVPAGDRGR